MVPDPSDTRSMPRPAIAAEDVSEPTVLARRPVAEWQEVEGQVVRSDARVAELLLGLVRETSGARADEARLLQALADFSFRAFPNATHHTIIGLDDGGRPEPLDARTRKGGPAPVTLSRTLIERVLDERQAMLVAHGQGSFDPTQSMVLSQMETAIAAPLLGRTAPIGVLQLDIRRPGRGRFSRADVDLLSVFASQAALALEHLRMHQQQRRAFQSTIGALVHSLTLKDPAAAHHSERVQAVAVAIGHHMGLAGDALQVLSVAALLHDLGKQGVRDEVLFKPGRLTEEERAEMDHHASYTQTILDKIEYPEELREVPRVAAYHHEKLDGTGPLAIAGADIPLPARIISVADVFDALLSPRVYKQPLPPATVLDVLERGRGSDWDGEVIDALRGVVLSVLGEIYGIDEEGREAA
jgi:HD-GYP domain-containing protein (c-di-GMP phosphodiesterase class II)